MSFDEAWGQARTAATARQSSSMQLNQLPPSGGGGDVADLKTNSSGKAVAIRMLQDDIPRGTEKAGRHAEENLDATVREFSDWATGSGLKDAHKEWELQVKNLMNRLKEDREALQGTKRDFEYLNLEIRSQIGQLDAGRDPRHNS
ncbi:hypothetical protein [Streptomyces sp. 11x1]|uniref:hypothetical protein n=1 Tax=Streptomyces sp. 11x1 TaxID=3038642 RepID=UPI00293072A1|nr:hypothetical protein [Streptomyces sp. 11x1]WNZ08286.1 hypothetical protein P8T65_12280 [Streptomyces sp. 11x1]